MSSVPSNNWSKLFTYETLTHAVAGSVASMTAMSVFYPLDTVRSRLQLEHKREAEDTFKMLQKLAQEEGVESLYRGLQPVLVSLSISGFVYFYTFHGLRSVFGGQTKSAVKDLSIGALAGAVNVILTTPFWVVNTRMKMQGAKVKKGDENLIRQTKYKGIFDGLMKISQQEGVEKLWSGTLPSLVLVSNPALQFMVYESLKRRVMELLKSDQLSSGVIFILGAIAKSISTIITYPLQVVQHKSRFGSEDVKNKRMVQVLLDIVAQSGLLGLYKGLEAKLLQTVLTTAMMYLCYEKIVAFVLRLLNSQAKFKHN